MLFATAAYNFSTSELQKVVPDRQIFNIFTAECAFRHSRMHFSNISMYKSAPFLIFSLPNVLFATAACNFSTSELQKVVPDRQFFSIFIAECAFRHSGEQFFRNRNFEKCFETDVFSTFSLQNVLFATAACNF